jgi:mannose-6-phosphate isomerase-like protein (cupin superfamily)
MANEMKSLNQPEETRPFDKGKVELVKIAGHSVGRASLQPGWKWSDAVKPIVGTDSCQHDHVGTVISGRLRVRMNDGTEQEFGPGDAYHVPPGHDGWVVGDEPVVSIEVAEAAAAGFAKS